MNETVLPASWWGPSTTVVSRGGGCLRALTRALQYSRSHVYVHNSRHDSVLGASIIMSLGFGALNISNAACLTMRSLSILICKLFLPVSILARN